MCSALARQHDDRQVGIPRIVDAVARAHQAADVVAAHVGQHDVEQDDVGPRLSQHLDRLGAGRRGQDAEVVVAQVLGQKVHDAGLVVDDEHGGSSHGGASLRVAAGSGGGHRRPIRTHCRGERPEAPHQVSDIPSNWKVCNGNRCRSVSRITALR